MGDALGCTATVTRPHDSMSVHEATKMETPTAGAMKSGKLEALSIENHVAHLSEQHRQYLLARHGTLDLDPIPDMNDTNPYNWPQWRKHLKLTLVAFHAMIGVFTAAAIQPAFLDISKDLGISMQRTTYLVSLCIAVLGGAPLFCLIGNVGCAKSPSYATMGLCRAITAFFISPAAAMGGAVVAETFFKKDRARCMGYWTLMVTLGPPTAPFIFGFVVLRVPYRWIYWILAIVDQCAAVLDVFFFSSESLYLPGENASSTIMDNRGLLAFRRIDSTPLRLWDFIQPLSYVRKPCVIIPACAYAMVFLWGGIVLAIEASKVFPEQLGFNTQQVGLQSLGLLVGSVLGEQIGGLISDRWMLLRQRRRGKPPAPEYRLWLSYIGHALAICGMNVFAVQLGNTGDRWNINPIIGAAIASSGNQIVTTINITYSVDCYREDAASIRVLITFVRQTCGFIGPFWFSDMFENVGWAEGAGVGIAMMIAVGVIPTILMQW
ncbi:hypothetical protein N7492_007920, partial [Penicillium capsulatum]